MGDREAEADLLARLAILQSNRLRFTEAVGLGRRAVAAGRAARSDRALAVGLDGLKTAHAYLGEIAPLVEVIDELEPLLRRLGDLTRLSWTVFESSFPAFAAAQWDEAELRTAEAAEISRRGGFVGEPSWFVAHLGWLARLQGGSTGAGPRPRGGGAGASRCRRPGVSPTANALLAGTLLACGDADDAAARLRDGLDAAGPEGAEAYGCAASPRSPRPLEIRPCSRRPRGCSRGIETPPGSAFLLGADAYLCVARARAPAGDPSRARAVLAPLLAAARRLEWSARCWSRRDRSTPAPRRRWPTEMPWRPMRQARTLAERHGMAATLRRAATADATTQPKVAPTPPHRR